MSIRSTLLSLMIIEKAVGNRSKETFETSSQRHCRTYIARAPMYNYISYDQGGAHI